MMALITLTVDAQRALPLARCSVQPWHGIPLHSKLRKQNSTLFRQGRDSLFTERSSRMDRAALVWDDGQGGHSARTRSLSLLPVLFLSALLSAPGGALPFPKFHSWAAFSLSPWFQHDSLWETLNFTPIPFSCKGGAAIGSLQ